MAQRHVAVGRHSQQAHARPAGIGLAHALVNFFERVLDVRETMVPVLDDVVAEVAGERAELVEHPVESLLADGVLLIRRRRDRREADFPEPELLGEVPVDARDVERVGRQRHARANRPAAVAPQQRLDLRRDDVVAARAGVEDAELVLQVARTVDRDRHADVVLGEELDDLRAEQRRVGREAEVDRLPELRGAAPRVGDGRLQHRKVEKRLAAEERQVRRLARAALLEQELDAVARRLLGHELRLLAVLGVDDLVLAVLVAVRARQVALVRDVQHHRVQRERHHRQHLDRLLDRLLRVRDRAHVDELGDRGAHGLRVEPVRERLHDAVFRERRFTHDAKYRRRRVVEREDGGAWDEVQEIASCRLKEMELPACERNHRPTSGWSHLM